MNNLEADERHMSGDNVCDVSIVIPVYAGERTLSEMINCIDDQLKFGITPEGNRFSVCEVLLVHDCGPDRSDLVMQALGHSFDFVKPVWLSKNFGQHAATLAGMSCAKGNWVVTIDEDRKQALAEIPKMIDYALSNELQVVYAQTNNDKSYHWGRRVTSGLAKLISIYILGQNSVGRFTSFRLIDGDIARTLGEYCANGVYLDVSLSWICGRIGHFNIMVNNETLRPSGYSYLKLIDHFWKLFLTSGTRPLRIVAVVGFTSMLISLGLGVYALISKYLGLVPVRGWTSLLVVITFFFGVILLALGVVAEYIGTIMNISMGRPLYVISKKPYRATKKHKVAGDE